MTVHLSPTSLSFTIVFKPVKYIFVVIYTELFVWLP